MGLEVMVAPSGLTIKCEIKERVHNYMQIDPHNMHFFVPVSCRYRQSTVVTRSVENCRDCDVTVSIRCCRTAAGQMLLVLTVSNILASKLWTQILGASFDATKLQKGLATHSSGWWRYHV